MDVDDVASGYRSKMTWNPQDEWVRSQTPTHEALVTQETFEAAARPRITPAERRAASVPRRHHTYALSSLVHCGLCRRRMAGSWNRNEAWYRCGFPAEYRGIVKDKHPKWVYVREVDITRGLDEWLLDVLSPSRSAETVAVLTATQERHDPARVQADATRRRIKQCDDKLKKYRRALEAGTDPSLVAAWIQEVEKERMSAERELRSLTPTKALDEDEIRRLVGSAQNLAKKLRKATSDQRAALYRGLGVWLTYDYERGVISVECNPLRCTQVRVGGGT